MPILLEDLNLRKAERLLCQQALDRAGSIVEAAQLLGITRHALKRRMIKHKIDWPAHEAQVSSGYRVEAAAISAEPA
jgi:DNA-binding NtrC family response regulator